MKMAIILVMGWMYMSYKKDRMLYCKHVAKRTTGITQLFYQPLHLYKFIKFTHLNIKTLKTLRYVSVLGPSSWSYIFLAKVTILKVILISLFRLILWQHAVLCCVAKGALL